MEKKIIVFAPHPDDETLACGGTIIRKIKEGYKPFIVFLTDGAGGSTYTYYGTTSKLTCTELKKIRREEAENACKILCVNSSNLFFLNFQDRTLATNSKVAQEKVTEILRKLSPVEIYFPHKNDPNGDHLATNSIVKGSLAALSVSPIRYQYVIWSLSELGRNWSFPSQVWRCMKHKVHAVRQSDGDIVSIDIQEFLSLKMKAINEYKSQTTLFFPEQKQPILTESFVEKFLSGKEEFYVTT
ncbi:PIG-L family deacetylase [Candidatus Bathyarchaeota archaeon]|nr:PIG-L family deacetylase [Candidatus Bathyarchaeota archaeon]